MFNFDYRRIGAIRFLKIGRLYLSFGLSREYRPIGARRVA